MTTSNHTTAKGRQNRRKPVRRLVTECGIDSFLFLADPTMTVTNLTDPTTTVQRHIHMGRSIDGSINIAEQMTNTRSDRLSTLEPNSLSAFSFLAISPSIMSETPPQQYKTQNPELKTGKKSIASAAAARDADIMLGNVFIIINMYTSFASSTCTAE